jgi:hypothetical protein
VSCACCYPHKRWHVLEQWHLVCVTPAQWLELSRQYSLKVYIRLVSNSTCVGQDTLWSRICYQRDSCDCNILCFSETWLLDKIPLMGILLDGFSIHWADRTVDSVKSRGGRVCLFINNKRCADSSAVELFNHCSSVLEYLMLKWRPFYLPKEFPAVIVTVVYIPPQDTKNNKMALKNWTRL